MIVLIAEKLFKKLAGRIGLKSFTLYETDGRSFLEPQLYQYWFLKKG